MVKDITTHETLPNKNVLVVGFGGDGDALDDKSRVNLINILRKYYPKDYVSIGTLIRKLPSFLTCLCIETHETWTAEFTFNPGSEQYVCEINANDHLVFLFRINTTAVIRRHGRKLLRDFFSKDKFYASSHNYLKVQFWIVDQYLIYEKEYRPSNGSLACICVRPAPRGIKNYMMQLMRVPVKLLHVY